MHQHIELHYCYPDQRHPGEIQITYASGVMTIEHSASSYGQPVLILESQLRNTHPIPNGGPYGWGDLRNLIDAIGPVNLPRRTDGSPLIEPVMLGILDDDGEDHLEYQPIRDFAALAGIPVEILHSGIYW